MAGSRIIVKDNIGAFGKNILDLQTLHNIPGKKVYFVFILLQIISFSLYLIKQYPEYNISNVLTSGILLLLVLVLINLQKPKSSFPFMDKSHIFILLAVTSWFAAEGLYGYYNGVLQVDPYPSIADFFYLVGYAFFISYMVMMNRVYKIRLSFILSSIITFFLVILYLLYISIFIFKVSEYSGNIYDLVLFFVYPLADLFIILGSAMYYFRGRNTSTHKGNTYWLFICIFGVFFFVADFIYGYSDIFYIYNDNIFDLFFNIGYLSLGIAIIARVGFFYTLKKH